VHALDHLIRERGVPGIVETVPSYRSLLVYYDPFDVAHPDLLQTLSTLVVESRTRALPPARLVELPACYGGEHGFELDAAAARLGLPPGELARVHASGTYLVYFIGFTPGLPYMSGMPGDLTIPRLAQPRTKTPPGSIGIGGQQCCIYSVESPGGFWVLARTPVRLYDPDAADPVLLRPGDQIRFRPVGRDEYDVIAASVATGLYVAPVRPCSG
jgi:KipI family sensor histidine kinase inhibitor